LKACLKVWLCIESTVEEIISKKSIIKQMKMDFPPVGNQFVNRRVLSNPIQAIVWPLGL